ncbi:MAG TPA: hypothetical protein VD793_10240, partial [Gemmatimonadales bacterium]|nr:hypothetical protein [Gemmatimonadales bacterium]
MFRLPRRVASLVFLLGIPLPRATAAQTGDIAVARRIADITAVAVDEYALGVTGGRVVNHAEYQEAVMFAAEARRAAEGLSPELRALVMTRLTPIETGIQALVAPPLLRGLTDSLRTALAGRLGVPLDPAPAVIPSLAAGSAVFRERCASCHGPG